MDRCYKIHNMMGIVALGRNIETVCGGFFACTFDNLVFTLWDTLWPIRCPLPGFDCRFRTDRTAAADLHDRKLETLVLQNASHFYIPCARLSMHFPSCSAPVAIRLLACFSGAPGMADFPVQHPLHSNTRSSSQPHRCTSRLLFF